MTDPYQTALDQLQAYGLQVDTLQTDGVLRRVKVEGDKGSKKSGWYVAHEFTLDSGRTVVTGRYGNWKLGDEIKALRFDAKFSPEEKRAFAEKQRQQQEQATAEKLKRQQHAAERAAKIWPGLPTEGSSEYLARKKIHGFGCRYSRGSIVVPLWRHGKLVGLQWIDADGSKRLLTGTAKQGATCRLPGDGPPIYCEGYATGCSLRMATGRPVEVCFDADNQYTVVSELLEAGALAEGATVACDNDHAAAQNKGLGIARKLRALDSDLHVTWPEFEPDDPGTDYNDLHCAQGLDAVKVSIERAMPQAQIMDAVKNPPEPAACDPCKDWQQRLERNDKGKVLPLSSNVVRILECDKAWRGALAYCDFSYRLLKRRGPIDEMREGEWEDADTARLTVWLSNKYGFEPPRAKVQDALIVVAQRARFHPVRDYLDSLQWDGTERLDHWLADVYESTGDARYLAAVGAKVLIGAVARVMDPGCKMDHVMILEGRQGLRKSTSLKVLFGDWFSDAPIPIGDKDAYQNIQGIWCSELAELDSFNKAESTAAKLFFSQVRDRYRPSYGHTAQDFPRQCVFIGTTNQSEYLKDYTGNRRYWPVYCPAVNIDLLHANRDQYWAEAYHRYKRGDPHWVSEEDRAVFEEEQDQRMQVDPWQYAIEDYLAETTAEHVTASEILTEAIKKDQAQITRADQNRISPILRKIGWVNKKKRIMVGGKMLPRHVYVRSGGENAPQ